MHKMTREDDTFLQERFFKQRIDTELGVLDKEKFEKLKNRYYSLRGWNTKTGNPTRNKLKKIGIGNIQYGKLTNTLPD